MGKRIALLGGGLIFLLAALLCFGVGCSGTGWSRNWLEGLERSPGRAPGQFGECVVGADRIFDTPDGPVSFGLMVLFLLIALALTIAGLRRPATS